MEQRTFVFECDIIIFKYIFNKLFQVEVIVSWDTFGWHEIYHETLAGFIQLTSSYLTAVYYITPIRKTVPVYIYTHRSWKPSCHSNVSSPCDFVFHWLQLSFCILSTCYHPDHSFFWLYQYNNQQNLIKHASLDLSFIRIKKKYFFHEVTKKSSAENHLQWKSKDGCDGRDGIFVNVTKI